MTTKINPTIGRKVWFWMSADSLEESQSTVMDEHQAFDATVVFVHPDGSGSVNLLVADHDGETGMVADVPERPYVEGETEHGGDEDFFTWMPYQTAQAKKEELNKAWEDAKRDVGA